MKITLYKTILVLILVSLFSACGSLSLPWETFMSPPDETLQSAWSSDSSTETEELIQTTVEEPSQMPTEKPTVDSSQNPPSQESSALPESEEIPMSGIPQSEVATIYKVYPEAYENEYGNINFYCQISGLGDAEREARINQELKDAAISWLCETVRNSQSDSIDISLQTERFLSVSYSYYWLTRKSSQFYSAVTIDIETGKRVFLRDLIDISQDFMEKIHDSNIAYHYLSYDTVNAEYNEWLKKMSYEELLFFLESCQRDNTSLKCFLEEDENIGYDMNSFSLDDGVLILVRVLGRTSYSFTFKLDDIEDFLKVPKW